MNFFEKAQEFFCQNKKYFWLALIVFSVAVFWLGYQWGEKKEKMRTDQIEITPQENREIRQSGFKFINPLLECEVDDRRSFSKSIEFEIKNEIQEKVIEANRDTQVALYFRDLKNGPWLGINEQEAFSPASLLKVPLMMAYYKYAESDPDILNKVVFFSKPTAVFQQEIKPQKKIEIGKKYSVAELIEFMIKYSDNEATNLLFQNIGPVELEAIFHDLGINMPDIYDSNNVMSVKEFHFVFRRYHGSDAGNAGG